MKIGSDYVGVSAGAVIANHQGQFFLAKRGAGARDDQEKWEFPGGSVHFNETRLAAAKRNILEKYNIIIETDSLLNVYDMIDREKNDHWVSTTYLCHYVSGTPLIKDVTKCSEVGWFSLEQLQKLPLSRITKLNLADILNKQ